MHLGYFHGLMSKALDIYACTRGNSIDVKYVFNGSVGTAITYKRIPSRKTLQLVDSWSESSIVLERSAELYSGTE